MNKLRRVSAFAISLVFLIQALGMTAAAKTKPSDVAALLYDLKIMERTEDQEIQVTDTVKRKDFAVMAAKLLLGGGELTKSYVTSFSDVPVDDPASVSIGYVTQSGVMEGAGGKMFYPEVAVTVGDAVQTMVTILGYKGIAAASGGVSGFRKTASDLGILSGVTGADEDFLTISSAVNLIYNTLEAPYLMPDSVEGGNLILSSNKDRTLLTEVFHIYQGDGIVKSNETTALLGEADAIAGEVRIGSEYYSVGDTDIADYLGYNVVFWYYQENSGADKKIVSFSEYKNRNAVLVIDAEDILEWNASVTGKSTLIYEDKKNASKRISVINAFDVIYNGKSFTDYIIETLFPEYGAVKLIDNNGDGIYDVIVIDSYRVVVTEQASAFFGWVVDMVTSEKIDLDIGNDDNKIVITKDGIPISVKDIQKWDVLSVYEAKDNNERIVNVVVTRQSVRGQVSRIDYNDEEIEIDGKTYKLGKSFLRVLNAQKVSLFLGANQTFYLDHRGEIAAFDPVTGGDARYAFIRTIKVDNETYERPMIFMRLWDIAANTWTTYRLAEHFYINDRRVKEGLTESYERPYKTSFNGTPTLVSEYKINAFPIGSAGDFEVEIRNRDVIKYKLNEDGEILRIYLTEENTDYNNVVNNLGNNDNLMLKRNAAISGALVVEASATIYFSSSETLRITVPISPAQFENEKMYTTSISQSDRKSLSLTLYDVKSYIPKIVRYDSDSAKSSETVNVAANTVVVKTIEQTINEDDEVVGRITGYVNGVETVYTLSYDCTHSASFAALQKGDFIRCSVGNDGYVSAIARDIDSRGGRILIDNNPFSYGSSFTDLNLLIGTVCFVDTEVNIMAVDLGGEHKRIASLKIPPLTVINKNNGEKFEVSDGTAVTIGQKVAVRMQAGATKLIEIFAE